MTIEVVAQLKKKTFDRFFHDHAVCTSDTHEFMWVASGLSNTTPVWSLVRAGTIKSSFKIRKRKSAQLGIIEMELIQIQF